MPTKRNLPLSRLFNDRLPQRHADYLIEKISMLIITWARWYAAFRYGGARPFVDWRANKTFNKSANGRTGGIAGLIPGPGSKTGDRTGYG